MSKEWYLICLIFGQFNNGEHQSLMTNLKNKKQNNGKEHTFDNEYLVFKR